MQPGSFLASLTPTELSDLDRRCRHRHWRKGMVLCSQEESPRWVGAIVSGAAKVSVYTEDGGEVLLGLRGPGTLIGELEAADGKPRSATTTALESTEALIMPRSDFIRYLSSHADMRPAWLLIEALCLRVRDAETMRVGYAA